MPGVLRVFTRITVSKTINVATGTRAALKRPFVFAAILAILEKYFQNGNHNILPGLN